MVRVVSVASLGYDDYGGYFSDPSVDGVDYSDARTQEEVDELKARRSLAKRLSKPKKLLGGRKSR